MPHTSVGRFRKCGEKPRSANQTPVLNFRDLQFSCRKSGRARRVPFFPALSKYAAKIHRAGAKTQQHPVVAETSKGRCRKPDNDPSLSPPHVEYTATASLRLYYRNVQQPNRATSGNAAGCLQSLTKNQWSPFLRGLYL